MQCFPGVRLLLISRYTHTLVVNTDALTSQNRFLFHFIYPSLSECGGRRGEEKTEERDICKMKGSVERSGAE